MASPATTSTRWALVSGAFAEGHTIPIEHTADGADRSPPLMWGDPPAGTRAFALVVHDPDAPANDWVHWLLYDVPADCRSLAAGIPGNEHVPGIGTQGENDFGRIGWGGPSPPRGPLHHYHFNLFALDAPLGLPARRTRAELERAMRGHVLAQTELCGVYHRG